ncbi:uncharacterized conserved protein [Vibrio variabilis]|uniref:Uncharacterized conserved protein n=1 Tax=Vibrio variabilis TaxID=990271 RepID=A0ABQ0JAL4_9VIBR|nr:uncharacterized conserved protein [Vibrio variabilis]
MADIPETITELNGRLVSIDGFQMSKFEVTNDLYKQVMGYAHPMSYGSDGQMPVNGVSRANINNFLERLNAETLLEVRLPTEAEWQYAASDASSDDAVFGQKVPSPVGSKGANQFGLYDMLGNIAEITLDSWSEDAWSKLSGHNPVVPFDQSYGLSVLKGGSFGDKLEDMNSEKRDYFGSETLMHDVGFRFVISPHHH